MKKNTMMRIASVLLVAVLLSTCTISGTFAKYVTEGSAMDKARVAHWGVTVTPNGTMFEKVYSKNDTSYAGDNTVVSKDEWNLVAPGTTDSLTEVVLTGIPEVATRVTYEATVTLDGWTLSDSTEYCPIFFIVEGVTHGTDDSGLGFDVTYPNVDALEAGVKAAIEACKKDYAPHTDLYAVSGDYPSVTWNWVFETGHDAEDTDLGNKAAAGNHAVIQVEIKTTVTQID